MSILLQLGLMQSSACKRYSIASIDTRNLVVGQTFFALKGKNFDGLDYAQVAAAKGASAVVVPKLIKNLCVPQIVVPDVQQCLVDYAKLWRSTKSPRVIAITGSNGKTTTRSMIQHALELLRYPVCASSGNQNNELGVSLTLLKLKAQHRYGVFELGASGEHEIGPLTEMVVPSVGVITNVSECHLTGFGSLDGVVKAKSELFSSMKSGTAIINVDSYGSKYFMGAAEHLKVVTIGKHSPGVDFGFSNVKSNPEYGVLFDLHHKYSHIRVSLKNAGLHNVYNAIAAIAAMVSIGLELIDVVRAVESFSGVDRRLSANINADGLFVIDDSYNASPASFAAAIQSLSEYSNRQKWLICGDMAELGDRAEILHKALLKQVKEFKFNTILYGENMHKAGKALKLKGHYAKTLTEIENLAQKHLKSGDIVLIKGSRSMQLDIVADKLMQADYA